MPWHQLEPPKVFKVTKPLSERFRDMTPAPNDRPVKDGRLTAIKKAIAEGQFRTCEWASVLCGETNQEYRVNGKHTSLVMSELNGEIKGLSVIVERYGCDSLEDVARLYSTFDTRASIRTTSDINRAFAASSPELAALSSRVINLSVTGISYGLWEDSYATHPADERASLMLSHGPFVIWLNKILTSRAADSKPLNRGPVAGAMYRTFQKSQKAADEFWTLVRDASGPDHRSADRCLSKYLIRTTVNTGNGARRGNERQAPREMFVKCLHGWNAWRRGDGTALNYYPTAKTPPLV